MTTICFEYGSSIFYARVQRTTGDLGSLMGVKFYSISSTVYNCTLRRSCMAGRIDLSEVVGAEWQ